MKSIRRLPARAIGPMVLAVIAVVASVAFLVAPTPDPGIRFAFENGEVVIASFGYGSPAASLGLRPGEVVTWLNDQYVLAMSEQAKQEVAQSHGPITMLSTTSKDDVAADEAAYARLVMVARQSEVPWIAHPETNPVPACYLDGSCIEYQMQTLADGSTSVAYPNFFSFGAEACLATDGSQVSLAAYTGPTAPGVFCILAPSSTDAPVYGYMGPSDATRLSFEWAVVTPGPGPTLLGLAILLLGWLIVGRGWAGAALRPYALTLPLATAVPLLVQSIDRYPSLVAVVLGSVLVPLAMIPLAIDFVGRMGPGRRRAVVGSITVGLALASAACGILDPADQGLYVWHAFLAGCVPFVPGVFAARPFHRMEPGAVPGRRAWRGVAATALTLLPGRFAAQLSRRIGLGSSASSGPTPLALIERVDIFLAAMTPGIAAISLTSPYTVQVGPLLVWLGALLIATQLIVRPLGRLATAAVRQRDLVVAATEAERSRIAADIHDDALQDLTLLVRRLDAAGDTENAQAAREIAERLRAICGDLRLPVLDDLGVGPALEWLCARLAAKSDSIVLDRLASESRLPAEVELAVFRVAQEALSNAIRHGAPPIEVRYRAREGWVELEVDDAGSGVAEGAAAAAEQTGHLGLLNMTQRAEAIGATLSIGPRPGGGTRVSFIWEGAPSPAAAAAPAPAPAIPAPA